MRWNVEALNREDIRVEFLKIDAEEELGSRMAGELFRLVLDFLQVSWMHLVSIRAPQCI